MDRTYTLMLNVEQSDTLKAALNKEIDFYEERLPEIIGYEFKKTRDFALRQIATLKDIREVLQ